MGTSVLSESVPLAAWSKMLTFFNENSVHHIERREVTEYGKSLNTLAAPLGHGVLPS
jgi:hypothetical protein